MIETTKQDAKKKMESTIESLRSEFIKLRTGKASPAILEGITVSYYGSQVPLKQVANIAAPEPRLLVVQPWERNLLGEIEKAILKSDLGFNPSNDGIVVRVPIPQLTEERRLALVKVARKVAEESRIAIRNIRRDANEKLKKAEKNHEISEDDSRRAQDQNQEVTDSFIKKIDGMLEIKEKEIMEV